jgi:PleD family two-component response regulator
MHLTSAKPDAYGEREQDFLERLAAQIAPSIENLILYASQNGEVGLPIAPAHEPETPPTSILTRKELEELGQEVRKLWKMLLTSFIIAHQVGVRAPEASLKVEVALAPKALIIDSDPVLVNQLTSALSQADFEVLSASDCSQGLLKLGEAHPKLVILTETLPDSGQICSQIRKSHDIPIIMLGSDPTEEAWARALSWGADAYFMKSISKPELVSRIRAILRRYQPPPIARTRNED